MTAHCVSVNVMRIKATSHLATLNHSPADLRILKRQQALVAIGIGLLFLEGGMARAEEASILEARVSKVLDGDTFTLSGESRRIRIWGLDAPERNHQGGSTATSTLRSLISGKHLRCAVLDVDRYGRLVAQCLLHNGRDITAEMIRSGTATEYCRYSGGYYGTC